MPVPEQQQTAITSCEEFMRFVNVNGEAQQAKALEQLQSIQILDMNNQKSPLRSTTDSGSLEKASSTVSQFQHLSSIRDLNLSNNRLGQWPPELCNQLSIAFKTLSETLESLNLSSNQLGFCDTNKNSIKHLARGIKKLTGLKSLNLNSNKSLVENENAATTLFDALASLPYLEELRLEQINISQFIEKTWKALGDAVASHKRQTDLTLHFDSENCKKLTLLKKLQKALILKHCPWMQDILNPNPLNSQLITSITVTPNTGLFRRNMNYYVTTETSGSTSPFFSSNVENSPSSSPETLPSQDTSGQIQNPAYQDTLEVEKAAPRQSALIRELQDNIKARTAGFLAKTGAAQEQSSTAKHFQERALQTKNADDLSSLKASISKVFSAYSSNRWLNFGNQSLPLIKALQENLSKSTTFESALQCLAASMQEIQKVSKFRKNSLGTLLLNELREAPFIKEELSDDDSDTDDTDSSSPDYGCCFFLNSATIERKANRAQFEKLLTDLQSKQGDLVSRPI